MFCKDNPYSGVVTALVSLALLGCIDCYSQNPALDARFHVREHVVMYGSAPRMFWDELNDPINDPILFACVEGAKREQLLRLGVQNVSERLARLVDAAVMTQDGNMYKLAFPSIVGEKRVKLQLLTSQVAASLMDTARKMVDETIGLLGEKREMAYHVFWSLVMDGDDAWRAVEQNLQQQHVAGDVSLKNKAWLVFPEHPARAGTNTYPVSRGELRVTHNNFTPRPNAIADAIRQHGEFIPCAKERGVVKDLSIPGELLRYGLIDERGNPLVWTIVKGSDVENALSAMGTTFGQSTMQSLDVGQLTETLDVSPGTAILMAYHEVCWDILNGLVREGKIVIPEIARTSSADLRDTAHLLSLKLFPCEENPFLATPVSAEEAAEIGRFNNIKMQILSGHLYANFSSPVDALLSLISAMAAEDPERYQHAQAPNTQGRRPFLKPQYRNIEISRLPAMPKNLAEGDVQPIYVTYGRKDWEGVEVFLYREGKWRKLFNNSYPGAHYGDWSKSVERAKGTLLK